MFAKRLKLLIIYGLVIIILFPTCSTATEPNFRIVACTDSTRINPGENLTISVYIIGVGNTTDNFILVYFNSDILVTDARFMGEALREGLADKGTNVQLLRWGITIPENIEEINPFHPLHVFWGRDETSSPFTFEVVTSQDTPSGKHDLKIIYQYKDEKGAWHSTSDILTFHITTEAEQVEEQTLEWQAIEPYFLSFIAFLSALFIFSLGQFVNKRRFEKRNVEFQKKLLLMIRDEIVFNVEKTKQMKSESSKGVLPNYRLAISNKETGWTKIVEYRDKQFDLISDISKLYYKYDLLNRTLDLGSDSIWTTGKAPAGIFKEIARICGKIDDAGKKLLTKLKEIEK